MRWNPEEEPGKPLKPKLRRMSAVDLEKQLRRELAIQRGETLAVASPTPTATRKVKEKPGAMVTAAEPVAGIAGMALDVRDFVSVRIDKLPGMIPSSPPYPNFYLKKPYQLTITKFDEQGGEHRGQTTVDAFFVVTLRRIKLPTGVMRKIQLASGATKEYEEVEDGVEIEFEDGVKYRRHFSDLRGAIYQTNIAPRRRRAKSEQQLWEEYVGARPWLQAKIDSMVGAKEQFEKEFVASFPESAVMRPEEAIALMNSRWEQHLQASPELITQLEELREIRQKFQDDVMSEVEQYGLHKGLRVVLRSIPPGQSYDGKYGIIADKYWSNEEVPMEVETTIRKEEKEIVGRQHVVRKYTVVLTNRSVVNVWGSEIHPIYADDPAYSKLEDLERRIPEILAEMHKAELEKAQEDAALVERWKRENEGRYDADATTADRISEYELDRLRLKQSPEPAGPLSPMEERAIAERERAIANHEELIRLRRESAQRFGSLPSPSPKRERDAEEEAKKERQRAKRPFTTPPPPPQKEEDKPHFVKVAEQLAKIAKQRGKK